MADNDIVRLGFIGAGQMGQLAHMEKYWKLLGVELTALAEARAQTAAMVAKTYGITQTYSNHRDMLADAAIDAVVAIVPWELNAELVEDALNAGKHVLTEKPQVNTIEKGRELAALANRRDLVYHVGYMKRFDPGVQWARQKMADWSAGGAFGRLQSLRLWCSHSNSWSWFREPPLDAGDKPTPYQPKLEPKPDWMTNETWQRFQGWINYYSHQTNLARYLIGEDYTLDAAKCVGNGHFVQCTFDACGAQLYFDLADYETDRWDEGFEAVFNRAKLTATLPAPLAPYQTAHIVAYEHTEGTGQYTSPSFASVDGFRRQAQHFIAAVRGQKQSLSPATEALKEIEFACELHRRYQNEC